MFFIDPDKELKNTVKNKVSTRCCHKCKGRLAIKNQTYFYSDFTNRFHLELDCVRCGVLYVLDDDMLKQVQMGHQVWNYPFF